MTFYFGNARWRDSCLDELCGTRIDFVWGGAFPVKHVVRRYTTNPKWTSIEVCYRDWVRITPISTNWYEMSD